MAPRKPRSPRKKNNRTPDNSGLPPVLPIAVTDIDADGDLICAPAESRLRGRGKKAESVTAMILLPEKLAATQKPAAGVGDRFLVRLPRDEAARARPRVFVQEIIRKIGRERERLLAVMDISRGAAIARPVDRKARDVYAVSKAESAGAKDGDLVWIEPHQRRSASGRRSAKVAEIAGNMDEPGAYSLIALASHDIPVDFPDDVMAQAEAAKMPTLRGREDLRRVPLLTIDPADAKDHDDAVLAVRDDDPRNEGGFRITVAIADVSWFVRPGTALDEEARERGNSVYLPDRVVPMLPEHLSNGLCSLRVGEDRPCIAVEMVMNKNGQMTGHRFMRAIMCSAAKLSYEDAQAIIDGDKTASNNDPGTDIHEAVKTLHSAYCARLKERSKRSPLDLELAERKVILNDQGLVGDVVVRERFDAHKLIEEFMILANVAAAEALEKARLPLIYRVHDTPDEEKLQAVRTYLETLDYKLIKGGSVRPQHFNQILKLAEQRDEKEMISDVILRTQRQAVYGTENLGHFGLNLARYAHFTSPIRRYADLTVHRALVKAFDLGPGGQTKSEAASLQQSAEAISTLERRAMLAERETSDRYLSDYLSDKVGTSFAARIRGVTRFGLFVMLDQSGADGFIPIRTLPGRRWMFDEEMNRVVDYHGGVMFRLGQPVVVRLKEAAPVEGGLVFDLISEPMALDGATAGKSKKSTKSKPKKTSQKKSAKKKASAGKAKKKPKSNAKARKDTGAT
ncbi:MAG: ribonuclease R [Pseudomonadota bacterium]